MTTLSDINGLRGTFSQAALSAGLAFGFATFAQDAAAQQTPAAPGPAPDGTVELETINVEGAEDGEGETPPNTLKATTGVSRLPGTVQDTPQTITVVPKQTLQDQNVTTLDQALRNVPGVTQAIGEGGGGMNGDQFRIRGFQAKGDIYTDGLRDFGVYVRDSFAYDEVQVIKGPSSESFGMGTVGGAINNRIKQAHEGTEVNVEGQVGNGPLGRAMIDANTQLSDTTAARIVAMGHQQDIVDRDHVYSDRWGVLGALAFGLGTDTTWHLNYMHQSGERLPDMGVPIIDPDNVTGGNNGPILGRPVTEFGVPRENYYGKETDLDDSDVDLLTSRFTHEANEWLTITNDTRLAFYERYFAQTVANCPGVDTDPTTETCTESVLNGSMDQPYGFGGPAGFDQESWGFQNITTAVAKFETGFLRHEFVAGVDIFLQDDFRNQLGVYDQNGVLQSGTGGSVKAPGTIGSPNFENTTGYTVKRNPLALKEAESSNFAAFASDRVWFTDSVSVLGGVRFDRFESEYRATDTTTGTWNGPDAVDADSETDATSPKASLIFEPTQHQTYYFSWAKAFTPQGQFVTNENAPINGEQPGLEPEESELFEAGAKIGLLDGRLGLTGAVFQIDKSNTSYTDPVTGDSVMAGEEHRVRGIELGVTGQVTDAWTLQAAYTFLDSEITSNAATNSVAEDELVGNEVPFVPDHAFSLWTTYEISQHMRGYVPGKLVVGGGIFYAAEYFGASTNTSIIPEYVSLDALVSYEYENWRLALNGYNLTDELNYTSGFGNRAVVGPGRAFTLTVGAKF